MRTRLMLLLCVAFPMQGFPADVDLGLRSDFVPRVVSSGLVTWDLAVAAVTGLVAWHDIRNDNSPMDDDSGNGNTGARTLTDTVANTNGLSFHGDLTNAASFIQTAIQGEAISIMGYFNTNGIWKHYAVTESTTYVNSDSSASFSTGQLWKVAGSDLQWGSNLVMQVDGLRIYNTAEPQGTVTTNFVVDGASLGVISKYFTNSTALIVAFTNDIGYMVTFNNHIQDGSKNAEPLTGTPPTLVNVKNNTEFSPNGVGAGDYDGSTDFTASAHVGVQGSGNRTYVAWIKANAVPGAVSAIFDYGQTSTRRDWQCTVETDGDLGIRTKGSFRIFDTGDVLTNGQWACVAYGLNGTQLSDTFCYMNTSNLSEEAIFTDGTMDTGNTFQLTLGNAEGGTTGDSDFSGQIGEAFEITRAWSLAEFTNYYHSTSNQFL